MKTKELLPLPEYDYETIYPHKKALSSSQFLLYEKDPAKFYVLYVLAPRTEKPSLAMEEGRIFSALYADRSLDFRAYLSAVGAPPRIADRFGEVIKLFPVLKGGSPEYPLRVKHGDWEFRATLDDFVEKQYTIIENKIGEREWTQERVNFDDQLTFQAWCHWKKYGVPPRKIILNWVDCRPRTTKYLKSFNTTRSVRALKQFEDRVDVVIENLEAGNFSKNIYE
jgi:hypothetical protein